MELWRSFTAKGVHPLLRVHRRRGECSGERLNCSWPLFALGDVDELLATSSATGARCAMVRAISRAFASPSFLATTKSTRPRRNASVASTGSPVKISRFTVLGPTRRTSRCVPDQPGMMPIRASGSPTRTCSSAMRRSAVAASSSPPPSVMPLSTAITGWRSRAIRSKIGDPRISSDAQIQAPRERPNLQYRRRRKMPCRLRQ